MGLIKRPLPSPAPSQQVPTRDELATRLGSDDAAERIAAARGLQRHPGSSRILLRRLGVEPSPLVVESILTSLLVGEDPEAALALVHFLREERAWMRNAVADALARIPATAFRPLMKLLADRNDDVRLLSATVLGQMDHPGTAPVLSLALESETHVNVCAALIESLGAVGDESSLPTLEGIERRFPREPFLAFAAEASIRRIQGGSGGG